MIFYYQAKTKEGEERKGAIEAATPDLALKALQRRDLIVISLVPEEIKTGGFFQGLPFFGGIKFREIVLFSRQLSTLFEAKVPIVRSFEVLASETANIALKRHLADILADIQGGLPMSQAFSRKPEIFSEFFVNMVKVGEESGKLDETFTFLADYLERNYELNSKAKNALLYPAFLFVTFVIVMTLMLTIVVPKLANIITESGQPVPFYTQILIAVSSFARTFGIPVLILFILGIIISWFYYFKSEAGRLFIGRLQISFPVFGELFRKIYLARIADNLQTLMTGGVSMVRTLEITSFVVGNPIYSAIMKEATQKVRAGSSLSDALAEYQDVPPLFSQMIKVGEETGRLGHILASISRFYRKEVDNTVDNLVGLIEPLMVLIMGGAVGLMVASILIPIYNMTAAI